MTKHRIIKGDAMKVLAELPSESVDCIITSPPYYGLRDYGIWGQVGMEPTVDEYVLTLRNIFREAKRVLKKDGTLWLNLGDTYASNGTGGNGATGGRDKSTLNGKMPPIGTTPVKKRVPKGLKEKDLIGIPWRVAFALQADGWYLRQDIIWHKPNPMPESVGDRCTKAHEYVFLMAKNQRYHFDAEAIKEPSVSRDDRPRDRETTRLNKVAGRSKMQGLTKNDYEKRNKRSVWSVSTRPFKEAHFATFPEQLVEPMVLAGCREGGVVMDPFAGAATTGVAAIKNGRNFVGIELNPEYVKIGEKRLKNCHA